MSNYIAEFEQWWDRTGRARHQMDAAHVAARAAWEACQLRQLGPSGGDMWWRDAARERPHPKRLVIAYTKEYGALLANRTTRNPDFGWSCEGKVTHWMPLPDVPRDATSDGVKR